MNFDAVVLAGSPNRGPLQSCSKAADEALIKIGSKYMVEYVVEALLSTRVVNRIVVAGAKQKLAGIFQPGVMVVDGGRTAIDSLLKGLEVLNSETPVLVVCADIPLLTPAAVEDFILQCSKRSADFYYPIIEQRVVEERFPHAIRTYATLAEGAFTGGNIMLIRPQVVEKCTNFARTVVELRKNPVKLCQLFGFKLLIKYLLRRLSIAEIEERFSELLHITGAAVVSQFPEIGVDVDKPIDLKLVMSSLGETA